MPKPVLNDRQERLASSARQTLSSMAAQLPILLGVVLLTGLLSEFMPTETTAAWFEQSALLDAFTGTLAGSVAAGHPVTSYVLAGVLLERGVSLIAVTAFLVSWVTVGSIQLPAEMLLLGRRFAIYRNLICFGLSILIALLTVASLSLMGAVP